MFRCGVTLGKKQLFNKLILLFLSFGHQLNGSDVGKVVIADKTRVVGYDAIRSWQAL